MVTSKKTNAPIRKAGGVNKDSNVRVKVKSEVGSDLAVKIKTIKPQATTEVKRISKLNTEGMRSIVGDNAENIQQLLAKGENDSAVSLIYKSMVSALIDLIPLAEHAVRKSKGARGVYQINSLISSIRELLTDIQSAQDRGLLGQVLVENVIRPEILDLGMLIAKEYAMLSDDFKQFLSKEDHAKVSADLKLSRTRVADKLMSSYRTIQKSTVEYLQR